MAQSPPPAVRNTQHRSRADPVAANSSTARAPSDRRAADIAKAKSAARAGGAAARRRSQISPAAARQGIKNTSSPAGKVGARERRRALLAARSASFVARRPGNSNIAPRPSSIDRPARGYRSNRIAGPSRSSSTTPTGRAGFSATTRQGIKNTSAPAGKVGARECRQSPSSRLFDPSCHRASTR